MRLLMHILGIDDVSGRWYAWWSGFAGDIGELAMIGGLWSIARKHNCQVHRCPRVGRFPVEGTPLTVCRKHHPDDKLTPDDVTKAARLWKKMSDGMKPKQSGPPSSP